MNEQNGKPRSKIYIPPITLEKPLENKLVIGEYLTIKCRTNSGDKDSTTYDFPLPIFKNGSVEEYLIWKKGFMRAAAGQNATNGPSKFALARRLLDGGALTAFENTASLQFTETNDTFDDVLAGLAVHIFLHKALQKQKRFMRRFLKKPHGTKVKNYVERVIELNMLVTKFPPPSSTILAAGLPDDELLDLLEFFVPLSWQKHMVIHGCDPLEGDTQDFVNFCERIKMTEDSLYGDKKSAGQKVSFKKKVFKRPRNKSEPGGSFYCLNHRKNLTHDSNNCFYLKNLVGNKAGSGVLLGS